MQRAQLCFIDVLTPSSPHQIAQRRFSLDPYQSFLLVPQASSIPQHKSNNPETPSPGFIGHPNSLNNSKSTRSCVFHVADFEPLHTIWTSRHPQEPGSTGVDLEQKQSLWLNGDTLTVVSVTPDDLEIHLIDLSKSRISSVPSLCQFNSYALVMPEVFVSG
jgi:hypothetical protein